MEKHKQTAVVFGLVVIGILAGAGGYYIYSNRDLATPPVVSADTANSHYAPERNDFAWSVPQKTADKPGDDR